MAAIITDDFRRNQARLLVNDIKASAEADLNSPSAPYGVTYHRDNANYAIGIGKSNPWPNDSNGVAEDATGFIVDVPQGTQQENDDVIRNLISLKEVAATGVAQLIAKNPWTSGRKYKAYDPTDNDAFYKTGDLYPCYVTNADKVYLCLSNTAVSTFTSTPQSTQTPSTTNAFGFERKSDGYVWAHVTNVPVTKTNVKKFVTNQFVPIEEDADLDTAISSTEQNRTGGMLSYIGVTNGGSGYTEAPVVTLTLVGDSDSSDSGIISHEHEIRAKAVLDGDTVARIELQDVAGFDSSDTGSQSYWDTTSNVLLNVRSANVKITGGGGSGATGFARLAPHNGYAKNAIDILPTWFVGVNADFENDEGGDAPTDIKFRQLSLLKNFNVFNDGDGTSDSYDALKSITLSSTGLSAANIAKLAPGDIIKQTMTGDSPNTDVLMYFDHTTGSGASTKIFFHQNSDADVNTIDPKVNASDNNNPVKVVSAADTSLAADSLLSSRVTAFTEGEYRHLDSPASASEEFNGEVIFHENRRPFTRGASQTEEIKLIIQL